MKCSKCGYEPTMAEIQSGSSECPNCARLAAQRTAAIHAGPVRTKVNPAVKDALAGYEGAQAVVVVDLQMSFNSMVWFMVKWVLASIPAFIILFLILAALAAVIGFSGGLFGAFFK
ncbi:hypothetical protein [Pseudomonas sp. GV071]|uniref:hypothetical protein n=1 Tax=Pseudomonas sp. GV071 TaxID=2135754 RepID=UPI000D42C0AA|nr:hypothetical protein [Pseudomonas sp. GV071]PTQ70353.1 hypothetical protein C8K61_10675 [Pseudomonas sp. GV071]